MKNPTFAEATCAKLLEDFEQSGDESYRDAAVLIERGMQARSQALEEAAKICDVLANNFRVTSGNPDDERAWGAELAAYGIRGITPPPSPQ